MPLNRGSIKAQIEKMNKEQQVEVLRKLMEMDGVVLNENSNGTFINLTEISDEHVATLEEYVTYINIQESQLGVVETEKSRIQNSYFKGNKEMTNVIL